MFPLQMLITAVAVWLLTSVQTYEVFLLAALGLGLAGGSFIVGVAYTSRWFDKEHQGTGAWHLRSRQRRCRRHELCGSVPRGRAWLGGGLRGFTPSYWRSPPCSSTVLAKTDPVQEDRRRTGQRPVSAGSQLEPLRNIQVWRFATYYFFVFGAFVALASFLPRYYVGAYGLELTVAGVFAAPLLASGINIPRPRRMDDGHLGAPGS